MKMTKVDSERVYCGSARYTVKKIHYVPSAHGVEEAEPGFDYQLKPCPFCGSDDAQIIEYETEFLDNCTPAMKDDPRYKNAFTVRCPKCQAEIPGIFQYDVKEAVDAWNRRR